jgi:hypothetical protein
LAALGAKNLQRIRQGAYFNLICGALRKLGERYRDALASVARGRAKEMSDVDLLVVCEAFHGSMAWRVDKGGLGQGDLLAIEEGHIHVHRLCTASA